ncbi:UNVERIFIED_CONTAM: hypothetical protein Sradi_6428800 [Sesamum radiatum]|uniref:Uncharacterized protein n=1 Tax=Sesamum radiatum TaxID=300843 RepID=A0AAW2K3G5_SESRA
MTYVATNLLIARDMHDHVQIAILVPNTEDNKQIYEIFSGKEAARVSDRWEKLPMMIDAVTTMTIYESPTRTPGIGEPTAANIPRHDQTQLACS